MASFSAIRLILRTRIIDIYEIRERGKSQEWKCQKYVIKRKKDKEG